MEITSRVNLKPGSVPTKFCFVQEKESRKPPKDRKPVEKQQKISDVFTEAADAEFAEDGIENNDIELDIEGSHEELLRRRIKELELSLESEVIRRKTAETALEAKRFSVKNLLKDPKDFKFYTGFTEEQCYCLLEFLGDGMNNLTFRVTK